MASDERNFRSAYYEKVGFRSVEEKKSLNILLKEKPLNRAKLKQFCLSFTVPTAQRGLLWNLILGVLPVYPDSGEYVMAQRTQVYEDTIRAVRIMRYVDENTPKSKIFYTMWLLENKKLHQDCFNNLQDATFIDIAETLLQVFENDVEVYWIAKEFYAFAMEIKEDFPKLKELSFTLLEKEDGTLYNHLEKHNILNNLPLEKWYVSCFAGIISEAALVRIWDKICGGSHKILVFLFLVLFKTLRMTLLRCSNVQNVIEIIVKEKEDEDLIVNKAIESWQHVGLIDNNKHRQQSQL